MIRRRVLGAFRLVNFCALSANLERRQTSPVAGPALRVDGTSAVDRSDDGSTCGLSSATILRSASLTVSGLRKHTNTPTDGNIVNAHP